MDAIEVIIPYFDLHFVHRRGSRLTWLWSVCLGETRESRSSQEPLLPWGRSGKQLKALRVSSLRASC